MNKPIFDNIISLFAKSTLPKYVIDIGHSENSQGAINVELGLSEYKFNYNLATRILELYMQCSYANKNISYKLYDLFALEIVTRSDVEGAYKNEPYKINKMKPKATISLHCGYYNRQMSGTEVNYLSGNKDGQVLGQVLLVELLGALMLFNHGNQPIDLENEGGWFVNEVKGATVITKPFFIDNILDTRKAVVSIDALARAYIKGILTMEGLGGGILLL